MTMDEVTLHGLESCDIDAITHWFALMLGMRLHFLLVRHGATQDRHRERPWPAIV